MSIKIQGQTVVDNNKNIVDVNSATFDANVDARNFSASRPTTNLDVFSGYGGGTLTSQINADGSATFVGTTIVGNDPDATSNSGCKLFASGTIRARSTTSASSGILFEGFGAGQSSPQFKVTADGSAEFTGKIQSLSEGNNYIPTINGQNGAEYDQIYIDSPTGRVFSAKGNGSAVFAGSVESKNNFFVKAVANDQACFRVTDSSGSTVRTNLRGDGSASFAGTVDAAGFTVNGAALSTGGGDVSTLVESTNGTTIATAKIDSDGDRVLDLNKVVVGVDLGAMYLGKDEVNSPWQHGIYMDGTDSGNNDKTRILLYGNGSSDAAFQIFDGASSKNKVRIGHNGLAQFGVETDFTSGINISPNAQPDNQSNIDIYSDGTSTATAFRVYNGTASKDMLWLNHNGNAAFNLDNQNWSEGIQVLGNESNGSVIGIYNDGTKTYSAFRVYDSAAGYDKINLYHDGNAGFNLDVQNWDQGVKIFGNSQYGSGVTVYRDSTISEHTGAVFRAYDQATDTNSVAFYGNGNGFFKGSSTAENVYGKQALYAHTEGTGEIKIWKGSNSNGESCGVGWSVLNSTTSGAEYNTAMGTAAMQYQNTGTRNTALGSMALRGGNSVSSNTGSNNVAVGDHALVNNESGSDNVALGKTACPANTTGEKNTAVGGFTLYSNQTTSYNTAVGYTALYNQQQYAYGTALGAFAGRYDTSGNDSVDFYDTTCIGYNARPSGHYQVVLGDTQAYTYTNGGSVYSLSDARDKADVRDTIMGLDFIKSLRPVDYRWDYREDYLQFDPETGDHNPIPKDGSKKRTRFHHGLIAQEVKSAADGLGVDFAGFQDHTINGGEERMTLGYSEFIGPLIKAVQELSEENAALKARLDAAGL